MKQLFFVFSFLLVASFSANAQACTKAAGKSCCAAKKSASTTSLTTSDSDTKVASVLMEADKVAASNPNISKRTCEMSGTTAYYEKSVCETTGKISWDEVKFDAETSSFTKVASASMEKDETGVKVEKKACAGMKEGKACCAKKTGSK
ncbi:MAG: hypothetical protein IPO92_05985 [Saprospiraceae bacterium]|nr:hypothetical protein [Saprospiraceae bacterium]